MLICNVADADAGDSGDFMALTHYVGGILIGKWYFNALSKNPLICRRYSVLEIRHPLIIFTDVHTYGTLLQCEARVDSILQNYAFSIFYLVRTGIRELEMSSTKD